MKVVLATHNAHKLGELRSILGAKLEGIELIGYDGPEPVEDGASFAENALIKARAAAAHTGLPSIGDDSGICVTALRGEPGIRSARYAGTRDDGDNYRLLLRNLGDAEDRSAEFVCAAALVVPPVPGSVGPDGPVRGAESVEHVEVGIWRGSILHEPAGSGGFGYDPIFRPDGYAVASAELSQAEKNAISHRSRAFSQLMGVARTLLAE